MMRLHRLEIENFGPIKHFYLDFKKDIQTICGANGTGKTHIMNLLATLAGNDAATEIYVGREIGRVRLVVGKDGHAGYPQIELKGKLHRQEIERFKDFLGEDRINYGLTEMLSQKYMHGSCNIATLQDNIKNLFERIDPPHLMFTPGRQFAMLMGDGYQQALRLMILFSMENQPLIMEYPDRHIHIRAQRILLNMMFGLPQQIIYVTHSPEFIVDHKNIKNIDFQY